MIPTLQGRQRAATARATLIATTGAMLLGAASAWGHEAASASRLRLRPINVSLAVTVYLIAGSPA